MTKPIIYTNIFAKKNISREQLLQEITLQWLVTTPLYNMGEQVCHLSKEYKESHNNIPWNKLAGVRHRLVHDYEETNWDIVSDILFDDLPVLIEQLKSILDEGENH